MVIGIVGGHMSTFDSTKTALPEMIKQITEGKVQLPDFQRGWVWDDEHVRSLLVSVARSFPVGAVSCWKPAVMSGFRCARLRTCEFSGLNPEPERLILDGQQRLTSLTQVLALNKPVKTFDEKGRAISRYYYIDINRALKNDGLEDAFIAIEPDRKIKENFGRDVRLDLSTPEKECKEFFFPCNQILNSDAWEESLQEHTPEKFSDYMRFRKKVLNAFRTYQLPVIALGKTTSKEAVCLVFEKVNTGGVPLSVFELGPRLSLLTTTIFATSGSETSPATCKAARSVSSRSLFSKPSNPRTSCKLSACFTPMKNARMTLPLGRREPSRR